MKVKIKITFDYKGRRNVVVDLNEVSLWEILTCIEEQTDQIFLDKNNFIKSSK